MSDGRPAEGYVVDAFVIDRPDGRADGEDWTNDYEDLPGSAGVSLILESTTAAGVGRGCTAIPTPRPS
jgi:hypothetical protein